ncbi:MAG: GNAT family N-acetyltransferase [Planctomycetota bacterium]
MDDAPSADRVVTLSQQAPSQRAEIAVWTEGVASWNGLRTAAVDVPQAKDPSAAAAVLRHAVAELATAGVEAVIGPMRGSTWQRYRLVTERGERPQFFMEPWTTDDDRSAFEESGFAPIAHYFSSEVTALSIEDPRLVRVEQRLAKLGVDLRPIDPARFDHDLDAVYRLSVAAFERNPFYSPIGREAFVAMYRPIRRHLVPDLVTLAERGDELVGFVFGLPDLEQAARGEPIDTAVIKSLARASDRVYSGLGALLLQRCQQAAQRLGYQKAIHALMHEDNASLRVSDRYARPFRRYALYGRRTQP